MTGKSACVRARRILLRLIAQGSFCLVPLAVATQANAQAIFLTAPPTISHIDQPPVVAPAPAPLFPPAGASRPAPKQRATILRHLANNIQGYRLAGETGASEWPMYLTDKQARRRLQFQLGYLSAVSVMPEASGARKP